MDEMMMEWSFIQHLHDLIFGLCVRFYVYPVIRYYKTLMYGHTAVPRARLYNAIGLTQLSKSCRLEQNMPRKLTIVICKDILIDVTAYVNSSLEQRLVPFV